MSLIDSHSETEQIVWHRRPLVQVSLYHHQLTQQFVAHACPVRPHEQSASAEHAFSRGQRRWWAENLLKECMQVFKCWISPNYGPQFFRFFFTVHRCKTIVLDISYATLAYSILENFRGLELPRTRTRTRTRTCCSRTRTKLVLLEDKDFPQGQQHC